jgi:SAM-dependent methyltransferase
MAASGGASRPGWLLDELATVGRENLDAAHVSRYDDKEDASAAAEIGLLRSLGLNRHSTVVDLGAGTGQFALAAASIGARVIAVDPSPVMGNRLREKAGDRFPRLEIAPAGFLTYEHQGEPADFVYSRYALHHLPDFWKVVALDKIRAMLRSGGVFRLWDVVYHFTVAEAEDRIERWCATGADHDEGEWSRAELEEHVRDENSTFTWLLEPMLEHAGYEMREASYSDDGFFAKYLLIAT